MYPGFQERGTKDILSEEEQNKLERLRAYIKELGSLAVGFSGVWIHPSSYALPMRY